MAKYVTTSNILWRIENFASVYKMSGPTIRIMGRKFLLSISLYVEAGSEKLQLILENLCTAETSKPWQFNIDTSLKVNNAPYGYMKQTGTYSFTHCEWRVWSDLIQNIHKNMGQKTVITFLVVISPATDFEMLFRTGEYVEEIKEVTPCSLSFCENIGSLFNNAEYSDFTITCGDRSFFVHKAILSARSDFFAGMFRSDMKETSEKEGKIEKIEPDILELVLRYLYTGELPTLPKDSLLKVYAAADRFIVEPLKTKCNSLLIDAFKGECKVDSEKVKGEQSEKVEKQVDYIKKRQALINLLMSREWRLFSEVFPDKAQEMCKSCLVQEL